MFLRFGAKGDARIVQASTTLMGLNQFSNSHAMLKRAAKRLEAIEIDPDSCIYLRNRAISALELHGPNQNWDAFEYPQLGERYSSFIGQNISVDHLAHTSIGTVLDSEFIKTSDFRHELDIPMLPLKDTLAILSERCAKETMFNHVLGFANANKLVKNSDRKQILEAVASHLCLGGWVENIWAIDKQAADDYLYGLSAAILKEDVTDTSMGCLVNQAVCSVCGNIATGESAPEDDFCEHMLTVNKQGRYDPDGFSMKGRQLLIGGLVVIPFEVNRDFSFFEDSLILPRKLGGKAGGEGADKDAKLLEVFGSRKHRAYIEMNPNPPAAVSYNPDKYVMLGDTPDIVEENKAEFQEQVEDFTDEEADKDIESGEFPEGTYITCVHENEKVNAVVIEKTEGGGLLVAIEGIDEPVEVGMEGVEVIEYPEEMETEDIQDINEVSETERHPEKRSAGKKRQLVNSK